MDCLCSRVPKQFHYFVWFFQIFTFIWEEVFRLHSDEVVQCATRRKGQAAFVCNCKDLSNVIYRMRFSCRSGFSGRDRCIIPRVPMNASQCLIQKTNPDSNDVLVLSMKTREREKGTIPLSSINASPPRNRLKKCGVAQIIEWTNRKCSTEGRIKKRE
uniref:Orf157 protein n=1 Tax=Pisum sativum TaxID=3888 RepID=Q32917_PEA|nr:orf157 [Pisum sativum]